MAFSLVQNHKMTDQYPILKKYTYLNTANHGLLSQRLLDYRRSLDQRLQLEASLFTNERHVFIDAVRTTIAGFIDADASFTAVIPNFSLGYNMLIEGINPAATFLLLENDYPAVNEPVASRGFTCHYAKIDAHLEANILAACKKYKPDFFCFSLVQYISGIMLSLDFLRDLKQQFPGMTLIGDLTQYVGVEKFRFRESGLDIILASCYKWLHAGDGHGFIAVKPAMEGFLNATRRGYKNDVSATNQPMQFINRFEPGHQDMLAFGTLQEAIIQAQELGWDFIESRTKGIASAAKTAFEQRGLLDEAVFKRDVHSAILNIKGDKRLYDLLLSHNIITSLRGNGLRVSFSYFNTVNDLNKFMNILDL